MIKYRVISYTYIQSVFWHFLLARNLVNFLAKIVKHFQKSPKFGKMNFWTIEVH